MRNQRSNRKCFPAHFHPSDYHNRDRNSQPYQYGERAFQELAPQQRVTIPLPMAAIGRKVYVVSIRGGGRINKRLKDLGLNLDAEIRVLKNDLTGPLIIAVKEDGRLALGRGMAHHIIVAEKEIQD